MEFDIKDVKSWATRHDVKVGDVGYVTCDFNTFLLTTKVALVTKATVKDIDDNDSRCFLAQPLDGKVVFHYGFFLPVDAVKEDKPKEKGYRPFRTIAEVDEVLAKDNVKHYCFVGSGLYLRYKAKPNITKQITITNLEVDTKTNRLLFINSFTPKYLVKTFDIKLAGEWFPFGVEVKDE